MEEMEEDVLCGIIGSRCALNFKIRYRLGPGIGYKDAKYGHQYD